MGICAVWGRESEQMPISSVGHPLQPFSRRSARGLPGFEIEVSPRSRLDVVALCSGAQFGEHPSPASAPEEGACSGTCLASDCYVSGSPPTRKVLGAKLRIGAWQSDGERICSSR